MLICLATSNRELETSRRRRFEQRSGDAASLSCVAPCAPCCAALHLCPEVWWPTWRSLELANKSSLRQQETSVEV